MNDPTNVEIVGSVLFGLAILHSFLIQKVHILARRVSNRTLARGLFYFSEIELVFAIWAVLLFTWIGFFSGADVLFQYIKNLHFGEPLFVFFILLLTATRPVLVFAQAIIRWFSRILRRVFLLSEVRADLLALFILGPLSGSFITEPAAMTVSALLLNRMIKVQRPRALYAMLGVLFVNVSIGGAMTPFAAPPILMVARIWDWGFQSVFFNFGWKVILAVLLNAFFLLLYLRDQVNSGLTPLSKVEELPPHRWRFRESFLVALFLAGLVCFGPLQAWWIGPFIQKLGVLTLYIGATVLTGFVDNAALTYLGSQVAGLSSLSQYYLVAGAIAGGGLTIIANAPNAAGFQILQGKFKDGLEPIELFFAALVPTLVAFICLGL